MTQIWNQLEVMMRKMELMEVAIRNRDVETEALQKELQVVKKEGSRQGVCSDMEEQCYTRNAWPNCKSESNAEAA